MTGNTSTLHTDVDCDPADPDDWGGIDTTPTVYKGGGEGGGDPANLAAVPAAPKAHAGDLRSHILAFDDTTWDVVTIPEWGNVPLIIRSGTGETRADLLDAAITIDEATEKTNVDLKKIYPDLVIHSVVDPTAVPGVEADVLLACPADERKKHAAAVGNAPTLFSIVDRGGLLIKNGAALERVGKVASKLWGLDKEAEKVAAKNSDGTPNAGATSSS